jgi:hypothetical protein
VPESPGAANATAGALATAIPTPTAAISAQTPSMCLALPMVVPFAHPRRIYGAVVINKGVAGWSDGNTAEGRPHNDVAWPGGGPGESQASDRRHVLACVVATVPGTPGDRVSQAAAVVAALLPPSL